MIQQNKAIKLLIILIFILSFVPIVASAAPFAYITNYGSNNVSVIDTSSNTVTDTVAVGSSPYGVAVNPAGTRVYVANYGSNNVSVIDTSNNTVTDTVAVGSSPRGVAVNPEGTHVYVSNEISNNVSVIDTSSNTVTDTVAVGSFPIGVAVNPAGTHVYVSNYGSNNVSVIDTSNNTVTATVAVGTNPHGVAVNPTGTHVYVSNYGSKSVSVIDTSTNTVTDTVAVGSFPIGVAVNPAGTRMYVSNYFSNSVSVINTSTNSVIDTVTPVISPWGVAVNPAGTRVYVSNSGSKSVSVIDTSTNTVTDTVTVGSNPIAYGIFISPEGASDTTASTIYVNTTGWWRDGGAFNESSTRIQAAIDNATAGDTIYVYNGTYVENVNVNEQVILQGEGADVVNVTNSTADSHVFNVTMDYVNISGFNVSGATNDELAGIYLASAEHCYISDNIASGNNCSILLDNSSNNTLTNNTASGNYDGILLYTSSNNTLTSNNANLNNNYGIYLDSSSDNTIYNNYFNNTNNTFDNGNNIWNVTKTPGMNIIGGLFLGGNYWSDYAGTDMNGDGLGDTPYNSSGNILNGGDYHPLVTTENINPVVNTVTLDNPNPYTGDAILVTVNATDNVEVTNVTADDVELTHQDGDIWNGTITAIEGTQYVNVSAKDAAGNTGWNNSTSYIATTIDNTDPVIKIATPTTSSVAYKSGGQQMYVNFTYVESNPKNYTIQIRNATAIINAITATTTSSPVNVSFTMNATAVDGNYNVTVIMWDYSTNTNTATEDNAVIIDTTPPTAPTNLIHTDDAPDGYDNDNSTDISWKASNDASPVIYRIYKDDNFTDSTELEAYTFTNEIEGSHEYNVSAIDSAGNINTTNESVKVIVDYTDPVIHNVSLSVNTTSYGQQIIVSVNATDKITNITSVTAGSIQLTHQSGMLWNGNITAVYGTNTVTVTAYDNASNSATNNSLSYTGPAAPKDSRGSSGGGGGLGGSDEPENVEETVFLRIYLSSGDSSTYNFNNVVTSVEVTPARTYGLVAAKIEVLFDQPGSITTDPPAGIIHKYVNVFFGTSGWSKDKFSSSVINFQVPASWFEENNIDPATVTLYRYNDGEWQSLTTTMTGQAGGNYQYSSPTPGFSTFLILGQVEELSSGEPVATPDSGTVADPTPAPEATSTKGTPGFGILVGIMGVLIAVYFIFKKKIK